jgi:hypothetical protein
MNAILHVTENSDMPQNYLFCHPPYKRGWMNNTLNFQGISSLFLTEQASL